MPRSFVPRIPHPPPAPSKRANTQNYLQNIANLQEADDKYLRLCTKYITDVHEQLEQLHKLVPASNKRNISSKYFRNLSFPSYTLKFSRLSEDLDTFPSAVAQAQAAGHTLQQHLSDLQCEPYPPILSPSPSSSSSVPASKPGPITLEMLLDDGMETFKRRVAAMNAQEKEDALTTLRLHMAGTRARLDEQSSRLLEFTSRQERGEAGKMEVERAEIQRTPSDDTSDEKRALRRVKGADSKDKGEAVAVDAVKVKPASESRLATTVWRPKQGAKGDTARGYDKASTGEASKEGATASRAEAEHVPKERSIWEMQKQLESSMRSQ